MKSIGSFICLKLRRYLNASITSDLKISLVSISVNSSEVGRIKLITSVENKMRVLPRNSVKLIII